MLDLGGKDNSQGDVVANEGDWMRKSGVKWPGLTYLCSTLGRAFFSFETIPKTHEISRLHQQSSRNDESHRLR